MKNCSKYSSVFFKTSLVSVSVAFASLVNAAGFALSDQSATASGSALSTAGASSEDISFSYWNPALFLNATKKTLYVSGAYIMPSMDITNISGTDVDGSSLSGDSTNTDSVENSLIPSLYYAQPLADGTVMGISLNVPFGLSGDYGDDWAGRFESTSTSFQDIALSFTLAQRVNKWFSVGASVQVHRAEVSLEKQVGTAVYGTDYEGSADVEASATGYGYSLGVLFTPRKGTRIGIGYRSKVSLDFNGTVSYSNVSSLNALGYGLVDTTVSDTLVLPDLLTISLEQQLTPKLKLGISAIRTGWSSMRDGLDIDFDSDQEDDTLYFGFEDQWMHSIGLTYDYSDNLVLRTGIALDNSPATDEYRSAVTPDGDRVWYSVGATYTMKDRSAITVAYTYLNVKDVSVYTDDDDDDSSYSGDYSSYANIFSLAYNKSF